MLPQMAFNYSCLAFVAVLLLCFSSSVNPKSADNYPTGSAHTSWTNSPSLPHTFDFDGGENIRYLLLRRTETYGLSFAAGFYCFSKPCKRFFLSIYIVCGYCKLGDSNCDDFSFTLKKDIHPQVIWSANRARPVSENATLQLTSKDGLTLRDSDGSLVWSTSGLNRSVAGINITEAGNLILYDIKNSTIWQSFDHPTDCLLMGQTLAVGMNITANSYSTDLVKSKIYLTLLREGLFGFVGSNPPLRYYADQIIHTYVAFVKFTKGSFDMHYPFINESVVDFNHSVVVFTFPLAQSIQYMRLESDGHLRLYDFDGLRWIMISDLFNMGNVGYRLDNCDYPTVCGHYGFCHNGQCTCPAGTLGKYFKQVDNQRPELGCYAVTKLSCQRVNNHRLVGLNNVYYFNYVDNIALEATDDKENCKKACLRNCSCKAVVFQSPYGNSSVGKCLTLPEVFTLKNYQPVWAQFNSSVYIKVQAALSPPSNSNL